MISEQISSAFRNLNIAQSVREARDPLYEEDGEAAPAFRRQSNSSRLEDSLGGRQHGARVSFGYPEIDRPDMISNTISNWRIKFTMLLAFSRSGLVRVV